MADTAGLPHGGPAPSGDRLIALPRPLAGPGEWTDRDVAAAGCPVEQVRLATVGGGLASFALLDQLRVRGTPARHLAVVTDLSVPYEAFRRSARHGQLDDTDRVRSDSASRIDNPWGFPGYAAEEVLRERRPAPLVRALLEPVLAPRHTPRAEQVYRGVDREAARIGWEGMRRPGTALAVRRRAAGGFFVAYAPAGGGPVAVLRAEAVHLGTGHRRFGYAATARRYRADTADRVRVVHAYEAHEHVYRTVADLGGGTVLVHGSGITASQVVARLADDRRRLGLATRVVQVTRPHSPTRLERRRPRRPERDGIAVQPYSAPRAAFGGQLLARLERSAPGAQVELQAVIDRPTTPHRRRWARELSRAEAEGWFRPVRAEVTGIHPPGSPVGGRHRGDGLWVAWVSGDRTGGAAVDFVVECTGFDRPNGAHPLLAGLDHHPERPDRPDRDGPTTFAVPGTRDHRTGGAVYVTGAARWGAAAGPRDSFWGMTEAALRIADDLASAGLAPRLGTARSLRAWARWVGGRAP